MIPVPWRHLALALALALAVCLASCQSERKTLSIRREQLFSLGYGKLEDQLDLFQVPGSASPMKTRITLRDGIIYIANGGGHKLLGLSSFGDLLSMIYDPTTNPVPVILNARGSGAAIGRPAVAYPLNDIGEVAIGPEQNAYLVDRLPQERRVQDPESGILLDSVILRFSRSGEYRDYLGQEGIGGTPFPYISGLYAMEGDECAVVSMTQDSWYVHWFNSQGRLLHSLRIDRDRLPYADGEAMVASLDMIVPDPSSGSLLVKIDYYKESFDPATKAQIGMIFSKSFVWLMDLATASFGKSIEIPAFDRGGAGDRDEAGFARPYEFLGAATGGRLFFIATDDAGLSYVSIFDMESRSLRKYSIEVAPEELYYSSFHLAPDGMLLALLATRYEAKVVWWRFDTLIEGLSK